MNRQSNQARQSYVLSNTVSCQSSPKLLHTTVPKGNDSLQESMCCACCLFCTSHLGSMGSKPIQVGSWPCASPHPSMQGMHAEHHTCAKMASCVVFGQVQSTCERGHMPHCASVSKHLAGEASHAIAWPMHGPILS